MNIVKHNPWGTGLVAANQYPKGLSLRIFSRGSKVGGWLRRGLNKILGVAKELLDTALPFGVGEYIGEQLITPVQEAVASWTALGAVVSTSRLPGSYEITEAEEQLLDQWLNTKFSVWLKAIIEEVGAALKLQNPQTMLIALNAIENKINIVQDHYAVADTQGLSALAIEQRSYLIYTALLPVHEAIKSGIAAKGLQVTTMPVQFQASAYNLMPLFASTILTTVQGENYKLATGSGTNPGKTLPVSTGGTTKPGTINTGTNPGTGKGGTQVIPISSGGNTNTGTVSVVDNKGKEVQQQEQPSPAKKFNYWTWLAAAALAGGVIAVSKSRKKGGRPAKSKK